MEDLADCQGTPTVIGAVVVARVRSVIAGTVALDTGDGDFSDAAVANRHSVARSVKYVFGEGKIELPSDVRAGDVLALLTKSDAAVAGQARGDSAVGVGSSYDA